MSLDPGTRFGSYLVTAAIGAGGMGEVYRASDPKLGRDVAIKVLPAELAGDAERLARFEREAKLLASLNHPNIAHVYGFESTATADPSSHGPDGLPGMTSTHFLVMELVEGEDLAGRLKRGAIPVDEALEIAKQIAQALEAAHEKGIVHRDLKPANVKVTPGGEVKVLDFGLAKAWVADAISGSGPDLSQSPTLAHTATQAGVILGTAAYMSPEQARGKAVDKRADIWAFGVLLFEMLRGKPLFGAETVSDTLAAVLRQEPPWSELPVSVPSAARRVLRRCLARDPRERLRDAADARLELAEAQHEREGSEAGDARVPSAGRGWSRWGTVAALLSMGTALGAGFTWLRGRAPEPRELRFVVTPPAPSGEIGFVRISRDGRRLVYQLSSEPRLLLHELDRFDSRRLPGTEGARNPFLSADGGSVGFYQGGKIRTLSLEGGDPIDVCEAPEDSPGAAWGPGDVILFSPTWTGTGLWRVGAAGGTPVEMTRPARDKGETGHFWPSFLPDGRSALFTIFGGQGLADSKVGLLDLESGRYEALFDGAAPSYVASGHVVYYKGGAYRAVPFAPARRRVTGSEITVLRDVRRLNPVGGSESYASFSETGVLAFVRGDSTASAPPSRLVWMTRDGRRQDLPFEGNAGGLSLSPDGRRVALPVVNNGQQQIEVYDLERGTIEPLTREGQNFDPAWHPDGRRVAFTSQLAGHFDLRWAPADGSAPPSPLLSTPLDEGDWSWAPDGASGAFVSWSPVSGRDLWLARGSGEDPQPLLASARSESDPAISPDGKWLAYVSDQALYVSSYPRPGERVLVARDASSPRWSRATREILFVGAGQLRAVGWGTQGNGFTIGADRTLFELGRLRRDYEVTPDGQRFLFLSPTAEDWGRDVIRVTTRGFDGLRAESAAESDR